MLLKVENLKTFFPIKGGIFKKTQSYIKAVNDVTLSVKEGEVVSIVGESGCGKSTVGNSILGLVPLTSGRIVFNETEVDIHSSSSWKPFRREYQVIFQDPFSSLNPRHSIFEIISEPMLVHGICSKKEARSKVAELLQKVGLSPDYMSRFPHAFSGGQRQRIGIARGIALNPKLIICDEIVSALDVSVQAQIIQLLLDLKREMNLSLLFIAHDLSLVRKISDRIIVMYLGKVVESASASQLFETPRHPYTQSLMSSIPTLDKRRRPVALSGEIPSLSKLPIGCSFYGRCPVRLPQCQKELPPKEGKNEHEYYCFNPIGNADVKN